MSLLFIISFFNVTIFAHSHTLNVEYEECSKEENVSGENELWYSINELGGMAPEISVHLSHETPSIIYYFSPCAESDTSQNWSSYIKKIWLEKGVELTNLEALEIANKIIAIFSKSMEKWNDV